jgi:hypothetical protein
MRRYIAEVWTKGFWLRVGPYIVGADIDAPLLFSERSNAGAGRWYWRWYRLRVRVVRWP